MEKLLRNYSKVLQWLNQPEAEEYYSFLVEWRQAAADRLRKSVELSELCRAQGQLVVLERLLDLKHELRDYANKIARGEVTPKKEEVKIK